eukprot:1108869-Prymnesium_polylepis.2
MEMRTIEASNWFQPSRRQPVPSISSPRATTLTSISKMEMPIMHSSNLFSHAMYSSPPSHVLKAIATDDARMAQSTSVLRRVCAAAQPVVFREKQERVRMPRAVPALHCGETADAAARARFRRIVLLRGVHPFVVEAAHRLVGVDARLERELTHPLDHLVGRRTARHAAIPLLLERATRSPQLVLEKLLLRRLDDTSDHDSHHQVEDDVVADAHEQDEVQDVRPLSDFSRRLGGHTVPVFARQHDRCGDQCVLDGIEQGALLVPHEELQMAAVAEHLHAEQREDQLDKDEQHHHVAERRKARVDGPEDGLQRAPRACQLEDAQQAEGAQQLDVEVDDEAAAAVQLCNVQGGIRDRQQHDDAVEPIE